MNGLELYTIGSVHAVGNAQTRVARRAFCMLMVMACLVVVSVMEMCGKLVFPGPYGNAWSLLLLLFIGMQMFVQVMNLDEHLHMEYLLSQALRKQKATQATA